MQDEMKSSESSEWAEKVGQSPYTHWVVKNRFYVFFSLFALVILTVIFFQLAPFFGRSKQNGYISAELVYAHWRDAPANAELFTRLEGYLSQYPELEQKYDGLIGQKFLDVQDPERASPFIQKNLDRVGEEIPYFSDYGRTSVVISNQGWSKGLLEAQDLKDRMLADSDFPIREQAEVPIGSFLYAWNLIRIAFLQKQLQYHSGELDAWKALEDFLGWNDGTSKHPRVARDVLNNFQEKNITLPDYIAYRKHMLLTQ